MHSGYWLCAMVNNIVKIVYPIRPLILKMFDKSKNKILCDHIPSWGKGKVSIREYGQTLRYLLIKRENFNKIVSLNK